MSLRRIATSTLVGNMLPQRKVLRGNLLVSRNDMDLQTSSFLSCKKWFFNRFKLKRLQQQNEIRRQVKIFAKQSFHNFDIFHRAINKVIFISNCFGLMPLRNVLQPNPCKVKFQLYSFAVLWTVFFLIFGIWKCFLFVKKLLQTGINPKNIVGLVFYVVAFSACILFGILSKHWPKLLRYWTRVEMIFLLPPYKELRWSLARKLNLLACWFGVIALVEHSMYYASCYYNYMQKILLCESDHSKANFHDFLILEQFSDIFGLVPFNIFFAFGAIFLSLTFTFIWNYMDLFIMLVGVSLATRFEQFAERMKTLEGLFVSDALWYDLRQHHIQLCELMEHVDDHLSSIILLAATNNMYFICNQLLNIFTKLRWPINYVYFWFSLIFLLTRTAGAFLCASAIHDASMVPLKVLYLVPTGYWTEEVQRFAAQLTDECISLTGKRFYHITRKNLFGFFSTIVTYELVLLQLDRNSHKIGLPNLCG